MSTERFISMCYDTVVGQGGNAAGRKALLDYAADSNLTYNKTGGLTRELQLQLEARYMITSNLDTLDGLVNGSTGYLKKVDVGFNSSSGNNKPLRVWLKMENNETGKKRRIQYKSIIDRKGYPSDWTPFDPVTNKFQRGKSMQLSIERTQFPMVLAEALTIHRSQGATYKNVVLDLSKGIAPSRSSLYVACSRATSASGLYIISDKSFQPTIPPKETDIISIELARLESVKLEPQFLDLHCDDSQYIQLISHNVQSIQAHLDQISNDKANLYSQILFLMKHG